MKRLSVRFGSDRRGATAIEYGLIAALIAVALVAALFVLTPGIDAAYGRVGELFTGIDY